MQQVDPFVVTLQRWIAVFMRRSIRDIMGYARESGLSMSQLGALFQIDRRGGSGVTDLGDHLGVTSSAASQLLERLVQQGLILRSEDPSDRRVKHITLTDKGRQVVQESIRARESWLSDLAKTLADSEKVEIVTALNILIDRANRLRQPVEPGNNLF
jgi:DNA-binding MarR family transcriptional regulator